MIRDVSIFGKTTNVFDCGDEAADWITRWLASTKDPEIHPEDPREGSPQPKHYRIVFFDPENECERDINEENIEMQEKLGRYLPDQINYKTTLTDLGSYSIPEMEPG